MRVMQGSSRNYVILPVDMPVFIKRGTLEIMLRVLLNEPGVAEVIAVDGEHSTDGSFELLERMAQQDTCSKVLCHDRNQGKGAAL